MCEDISGGQEDVPIPATNLVDDPPVAPTGKLLTLDIIISVITFGIKEYIRAITKCTLEFFLFPQSHH